MKLINLAIPLLICLSACSEQPKLNDSVILIRDDQAKKSEIYKFGVYCSAAWYQTLEHLLLHKDGTINDGPWHYKWTLAEFNTEQDHIWFDANCKEPPNK